MEWLKRLGRSPSGKGGAGAPEEAEPATLQRAAPALEAVFEGLSHDGRHVLLDLGPGTQAHLRLYSRFARQIRFANFLPEPPRGPDFSAALRELPPAPCQPYDVVLLWNLLDRLSPRQRPRLMEKVARITAPGARLYAVVDASTSSTTQPVRFAPLDLDRVAHEAVGDPVPAGEPLLPAEVERLLEPFQVRRAFTLRIGMREYMAVKRDPEGS